MLMDFNTEDLYTKLREGGQWEGTYPQYDKNYGQYDSWGGDLASIRPVKGTPLRFRKIGICHYDEETKKNLTGYFYTLATNPFIISEIGSEGDESGDRDWETYCP